MCNLRFDQKLPSCKLLPQVARLIRALLKVSPVHDLKQVSCCMPACTQCIGFSLHRWYCSAWLLGALPQHDPVSAVTIVQHACNRLVMTTPASHFKLRSVQILASAHAKGLAHGDLKTANVMCSIQRAVQGQCPDPDLFLVDFAQSRDAHDSKTGCSKPTADCLMSYA